MNITRNDLDARNSILSIAIDKSDYDEKVEKSLREIRRKANIPGFRPGMVPSGLVKKMYGKGVLVEEVNKLLSESLYNYIVENKLRILGEPLACETKEPKADFENGTEFEFHFDIAIAPEVNINLTKKTR